MESGERKNRWLTVIHETDKMNVILEGQRNILTLGIYISA